MCSFYFLLWLVHVAASESDSWSPGQIRDSADADHLQALATFFLGRLPNAVVVPRTAAMPPRASRVRCSAPVVRPMPVELRIWGCDDDLWNKIKSKNKLARLAKEGREEEARALIATIRDSIMPEVGADVLETLASWGCDGELLPHIKDKARLVRFAMEGREVEAREYITSVSEALALEALTNDPTIREILANWGCDEDVWRRVQNKPELARLASEGKEDEAREQISSIIKEDAKIMETLASWGCDAQVWSKVKRSQTKKHLFKFAREGMKDNVVTIVDRIRGAAARPEISEPQPDAAILDTLAAWGCDAELWSNTWKSSDRKRLIQYAKEGNEEKARKLILSIRVLLAVRNDAPVEKLARWGLDEELWEKAGRNAKKHLARLALQNDEANALELISSIQGAVEVDLDPATQETLASLGCDAELWSKISKNGVKRKLVRLARTDQWHARNLIKSIRKGINRHVDIQRNLRSLEENAAALKILEPWGCDKKLWSSIFKYTMNELREEARVFVSQTESEASNVGDHDVFLTLASWGCNNKLWSELPANTKSRLARLAREGQKEEGCRVLATINESRLKKKLASFAREGMEKEARDLIATIRNSLLHLETRSQKRRHSNEEQRKSPERRLSSKDELIHSQKKAEIKEALDKNKAAFNRLVARDLDQIQDTSTIDSTRIQKQTELKLALDQNKGALDRLVVEGLDEDQEMFEIDSNVDDLDMDELAAHAKEGDTKSRELYNKLAIKAAMKDQLSKQR